MVVISSMCFVMFLLCSLLLASQRPARGDDQQSTIRLLVQKFFFFLRELHENKNLALCDVISELIQRHF